MLEPDNQNSAPGLEKLPTWLKNLAEESWQVELLISGFAIVGTFQLLGTIEPVAESMLFNVRNQYLLYIRWALYYLSIGFICLPTIFVLHFAIRAFWVGLVSLSSVFPGGIGPLRPSTITEEFVDEIKRDYPSLPQLIHKAEQIASTLFALAAMLAMVFTSISISICVIFLIGFLFDKITSGIVTLPIVFTAIVGVAFLAWLISVVLVYSPLKNNEKAKSIYLKISKGFRKSIYGIFEVPATYLQTVLMTNISGKKAILPGILGFVLIEIGVIYIMTRPITELITNPESIVSDAIRTDRHFSYRYEDQWEDDHKPFNPYMVSEKVKALNDFTLYIPMLGEDEYRANLNQEERERPENTSDEEWKTIKRKIRLNQYQSYYRFELNSKPVTPSSFLRHQPPGLHDGMRATIAAPQEVGAHTLRIYRKDIAIDSDSFELRAIIPFSVTND